MEEIPNVIPEDELRHYGRKGMKWYQNIFSKPTSGGTRNKSSPKKKLNEKEVKKKKKPSEMTADELREKIGHMQLEAQYNMLAAQNKKVGRGRRFIGDMVDKAILPAAVEAGKKLATDGLLKLGKKYLGLDEKDAKDIYAEMKKEADYAQDELRKAKAKKDLQDLKDGKSGDIYGDAKRDAEYLQNKWKIKEFGDKLSKNDSDDSPKPPPNNPPNDNTSSNKKPWSEPTVTTKKFWSKPTIETTSPDNNSDDSSTKKSWSKPLFETVLPKDKQSTTTYSDSYTWKKGRDEIIDVYDNGSGTWSSSSSSISTGRSYVSGLLNSPIAGLLEAPKD